MTQYARPSSDITVGIWYESAGATQVDIYTAIDETVQSDADYIYSQANQTGSPCDIALGAVSDPSLSSDHVLSYAYKRNVSNKNLTLVVTLYDNSSSIASWTHANPSTDFTLAQQTLVSSDADAITDYSLLSVGVETTVNAGGGNYGAVSWVEFAIPDSSTQTVTAGVGQITSTGVSAAVTPGETTVTASVGQATFTGVQATVSDGSTPSTITRRSESTQANVTATTSHTITAPAGVVANDVLICAIGFNGSPGTITTPDTDWVEIGSELGNSNPKLYLYRKVTTDSDTASYTWTITNTIASGMVAAAYYDVDTTTPEDVTAVGTFGASASSFSLTGVTTQTDNAMLISCAACNSSSVTITENSALVAEVGAALGKSTEMADGTFATAGATGTVDYTLSASREWSGIVVALKPASGASGLTVTASAGQITFTGVTATITGGATSVTAATGQQTYTGVQASVALGAISTTASTGQITFTGISATVTGGATSVTANTGQNTWTGVQATITTGATSITAAVGQNVWTGVQASVTSGGLQIITTPGQVTFTGVQASITTGATSVTAAVGQQTYTGVTASISAGAGGLEVIASTGQVVFTGVQATITAGAISITASVGQVTHTAQQAAITTGVTSITAGIGQQTFTGITASVTPGATAITAGIGQNVFTGVQAVITDSSGQQVLAGVGQIVWTGNQATISNLLVAILTITDAAVNGISVADASVYDAAVNDAAVYVVDVSDATPNSASVADSAVNTVTLGDN